MHDQPTSLNFPTMYSHMSLNEKVIHRGDQGRLPSQALRSINVESKPIK
nr:hypothetical protein Q903MT_gene822 [Picea sitchensis]